MGWKSRIREDADEKPEAGPSELHEESSNGQSRRWPVIQKNAIRTLMIGVAIIAVVVWAMHRLALDYELNTWRLHFAVGIASCIFAGLFCLHGESVVEDGVKSAIIAIIGCLLAGFFPLPWCLVPGVGAVVGSTVNGTIQGTLGRYF